MIWRGDATAANRFMRDLRVRRAQGSGWFAADVRVIDPERAPAHDRQVHDEFIHAEPSSLKLVTRAIGSAQLLVRQREHLS